MSPKRDVELDAATLREELDLRWPDAEGVGRATTDESHRLVLCHPEYDGFVSLEVRFRADVDDVRVEPDEVLDRIVTAHHRTGAMARGQVLPIDLELHPGNVGRPASTGLLRLVDASGERLAPDVRLTIATDESLHSCLAGAVDGPFAEPDAFIAAAGDLVNGRETARGLARRIEAMQEGRPDPGRTRRRLPWRPGR